MTKSEFLQELESRLAALPKDDVQERLDFYSEMIDDRIEEGRSEEEAVYEIGPVDEVVNQIAADTPLLKLVKERVKPKRSIKAWEIVLIILGFPLWLPLLIVAAVLLLVFYILIWILVIVTYVIEAAFMVASGGCLALFFIAGFNPAFLGMGIAMIGLSIFMYFGCVGATKLTIKLTKKIALSIKKKIVSKGEK